MKLTTTMLIRACKAYSWDDCYSEDFPYKLETSLNDKNYDSSWVVGSFEVTCPLDVPSKEHIVACQLRGLEEVLKDHIATSYKKKMDLEQQIKDLMAIEDMSDGN